jgi:hypothetical protein
MKKMKFCKMSFSKITKCENNFFRDILGYDHNKKLFRMALDSDSSVCETNHSRELEAKFDAKYLGGHKMYPKPADTIVFVFSDRIEIPQVNLRITYFSMTNIENADEKKISALRVVGLGLVSLGVGAIVGALWKKRHIYTIIDYVDVLHEEQTLDVLHEEQTLVFDFEGKLEEAQQMIYQKMVSSHSQKKQLLVTEKLKNDSNQDTIASGIYTNDTGGSMHTNFSTELYKIEPKYFTLLPASCATTKEFILPHIGDKSGLKLILVFHIHLLLLVRL